MSLDLSSFANALAQLEKSLGYAASDLARGDAELARQFRAAAIQAFEFTYELSWKMLKRQLEGSLPNPAAVDEMSFPELIRTGSETGLLLSGWERWKEYRQARGTTSHTYDEAKADQVFAVIPEFLQEARHLLQELRARGGVG
jgi:nucleotidyltransferase substrate binding protein (TIGR01987 family)